MAEKAIRIKELRGNILHFLKEIYPEAITENSILQTYYEYYDVDDIIASLAYMREKGLLVEKVMDSPFTAAFKVTKSYRISADGIDLLDGTTTDPGIIVRRI